MDLNTEFETREALINHVQHYSMENGYYVVIQRSREGKVWLKCDRGGTSKERDVPRQRDTDTQLNGCQFAVVGWLFAKERVWKILEVQEEHNHDPSFDRVGSSVGRRLAAGEKARVMQFARDGIQVKDPQQPSI